MALIKCPECGKEVSDQSKTCIHCGFPLNKKAKGTRNVVLIAGVVLVIVVFLIVGMKILNSFEPNDNANQPSDVVPTIDTHDSETNDNTDQPSDIGTSANTYSPKIDDLITQSKQNVEPYLDVMGSDITNGNPPVSQDFIDNLNSVEIMGYVGSVEHGYNDYDGRRYIELMTWKSNVSTTNDDFFAFLDLMDEYFGQKSVLVSYDHIDDEIYGWVEPSKQFSMIAYFDDGKIYLQWDVRLEFEDEESLRVVEPEKDNTSSTKQEKCIECGANAYYTYTNPFSGKVEDYCYTHYQAIMDIMDMMEDDVGNSNYSKHTCEECSKEGTHKYESFTGQTEYYCTEHYEELMDMLDSFGLG